MHSGAVHVINSNTFAKNCVKFSVFAYPTSTVDVVRTTVLRPKTATTSTNSTRRKVPNVALSVRERFARSANTKNGTKIEKRNFALDNETLAQRTVGLGSSLYFRLCEKFGWHWRNAKTRLFHTHRPEMQFQLTHTPVSSVHFIAYSSTVDARMPFGWRISFVAPSPSYRKRNEWFQERLCDCDVSECECSGPIRKKSNRL